MSLTPIPACPPGFDCSFKNSCPNYVQPCPDGFFCNSYAGFNKQKDMDLSFAKYAERDNDDVDVTSKNAEDYINPYRSIQVRCLFGFYCPNGAEMTVCPDGHWCPEATVVPNKCDALSICPEGSGNQVNFMNAVIAAIMTIAIVISSCCMVRKQRRSDNASRLKDPSGIDDISLQVSDSGKLVPTSNPQTRSAVEVSFKELLFQVPGERSTKENPASQYRDVLRQVSGRIPAGKLSVILGPTACGKSTLLNLIRKGGKGATSGSVAVSLVNSEGSGNSDPLRAERQLTTERELSRYIGYVPQEDILDRELTVRELLTFNARARLPHLNPQEVDAIVSNVLSDLAIQHVADSIIGGGENRQANISGGQVKRVNIAVELVALSSPALLLLDEPTAGLDAAIAYDLIESLVENIMKPKGITILTVLQQPRAEIFEKIDHLFLMDAFGNIVYEGEPAEVVPYLISIGYVKPGEDTADADFCIDVLNGLAERTGTARRASDAHSETQSEKVRIANGLARRRARSGSVEEFSLIDAWIQHRRANNLEHGAAYSNSVKGSDAAVTKSVGTSTAITTTDNNTSSIPTLWEQVADFLYLCRLNAERLFTVRLRNRASLLTYFFINVIMACALSSGFSIYLTGDYEGTLGPPVRKEFQAYYPSPLAERREDNIGDLSMAQLVFFMASALGSASSLSAVPVFSGQLGLVKREQTAGLSVIAYAVGRMTADVLFVVFNGMIFAGTWVLFGHAGSFYDWIATIVCTAFAASAIGYICAAVGKKNNASVYAIILTFICCVFNGTEPTLSDVSKYPVVNWPWYISFATYTSEATYITWSSYLENDGHVSNPVQEGADHYGYEVVDGLGRSVGALIALGLAMRIIAVFILWYKAK